MLYQVHCAVCHGPEGHADGPSAANLRPPPRDFAGRPWRFDVTREAIRKVILDGIPGTAMPAGRATLSAADIDPLVDHVYGLATAQPITRTPSVDEQLLHDCGFVDLRNLEPPALRLSDAAGGKVLLSELKGRLVLVSFWGASCIPRMKELAHLRALESEFAGRPLTVLYVCVDADDAKAAQRVADKATTGVRALVDDTGVGVLQFEVQMLPTVWLIGPDGKAIARAHGAKDWQSPAVRKLIDRWLPVV
jgi:peroxiredoxin